ncbi:MAG TPA: hypothetical protein VD883_01365, partial [Candidatus Omnitrophota bacterium]|nr:hypothetical protein [Candidatus Omnitrophota bacterium]
MALVLALTFCASEISFAAAITPAAMERTPGVESILRNASSFEPPLDYSMLREVHQGSQNTFIIHIQDAHVNLSGQQNLAGALDAIMKKYGVSLVLVEGGSVDGTLDPIKKLASAEILKRVAKTFLMEGKISGEEYLNLTSDHPMRIIGVEDDALYMKSVETYGDLAGKRQSILEAIKKIQGVTAKLKRKIYPEALIEFEKKTESGWSQDDAGFEVRFKEIFAMTPVSRLEPSKYPAATRFRSLQEMEKTVDFKSANLEQGILIEEISQKGGRDDLKTHLDRMSKLKNQKLSQYAYFQNTLNIAKDKGIDLSKYQNLLK